MNVDTGCGGEYLTGQAGADINGSKCIYWTGGYNFIFKKIDGEGDALYRARFTLYKADENGLPTDTAYTVSGQDGRPVEVIAESKDVSGEGIDIKVPDDNSTSPKDVAVTGKGLVAFEKIPPGTYYVVEQGLQDGIVTIQDADGKSNKYAPLHEKYKVVIESIIW